MKILVTGAAGFLGTLLTKDFDARGFDYLAVDLLPPKKSFAPGQFLIGDVSHPQFVDDLFSRHRFDVVLHLASQIDFAISSQDRLYENNLRSAELIAQKSVETGVEKIVFTSSNSVYLGNSETLGISESVIPIPTDMYGKSKIASEQVFNSVNTKLRVVNLRCPNIIDSGRVGMLSILFELLQNNSALWTVGDGSIRHQCLYAQDLIGLFHKVLDYDKSNTFNIGSDRVPTFREMYHELIALTQSRSKVRAIPATLSVGPMKILHKLGLSPMGPYQFRMLTRDFVFDTAHAKAELGWSPTLNNTEMLALAYRYYVNHKASLENGAASANSAPVNMGVLKFLKWIP